MFGEIIFESSKNVKSNKNRKFYIENKFKRKFIKNSMKIQEKFKKKNHGDGFREHQLADFILQSPRWYLVLTPSSFSNV